MNATPRISPLHSMVNSIFFSVIFLPFSPFQSLPRPTFVYFVVEIDCNQVEVVRGGSILGGDWKTFDRLGGVKLGPGCATELV
jgi:hypothetical protein